MHLFALVFFGFISTVTLSKTILTQCGHSAFPPDGPETAGALDEVKKIANKWGIAVVTFSRANHRRHGTWQLPLYITSKGLVHQLPVDVQSAVVLNTTDFDVTSRRASWLRVVDAVTRIATDCVLRPGDSSPGWDQVAITSWLNVSIINPQAPEYQNIANYGNWTAPK